MELNQKEEETLDAIANGASKAMYWIVLASCLAFPLIFLLMFFGHYVGFTMKDQVSFNGVKYTNPHGRMSSVRAWSADD